MSAKPYSEDPILHSESSSEPTGQMRLLLVHKSPGTASKLILNFSIAVADWNTDDSSLRLAVREGTFTYLKHRLRLPSYFTSMISSLYSRGFKYSIPVEQPFSGNAKSHGKTLKLQHPQA